jgi:Flp pilus assembly protein TadG
MRGISGVLQRSRDDARGTISILGAFVLVGVVGVSALALEYGHALLQKSEDQRVADLAAYGGALVYNSSGSSSTDATSAASNIAALNGLSSGVSPSVVTSPSGDGNKAVEVTITTSVPLMLARVLTTNTTLPVSATSYAEIDANAPACIVALSSSGTGISLSGTGSITADSCTVASNSTVCADSGANPSDVLTTKIIDYGSGSSPSSSKCTLTPPSGTSAVQTNKTTTTDPLAGDSAVSTATSRLTTVSSIASPSAPSSPIVSGGNALNFGSSKLTGTLPSGCSAALSSSVWTVTCTGSGPLTFGSIAKNGGVTVQINTLSGVTYNFNGSIIGGVSLGGTNAGTYNVLGSITTSGTTSFAPGVYNVSGSITTGGTATFGAGTYDISQGITIGGGSTATFGAGTFNLGTASCSGTSGYSVCNTGTSLTIGGPSTFVLEGGIYNGGGAILSLGSGSTNSYNIGKAGDGNSINVSTSKSTTLADATGSGDIFETAGNIVSGGGTCFWIPAAAEHDINGYISLAGGTILGAGVYTVTDYVALGASSGGSESCGGTSVGVSGSGVTLVIGGTTTVSCGGTAGQAFCVGAGFDPVILTAPSSGNTAGLVMVGPTTTSANPNAGAWFGQGASNSVFSGAVYFPNGPIDMSGSATLGNGAGSSACLELIGSQVTLSAGTAVGSTCTGLGGGSTGTTVSLVQ